MEIKDAFKELARFAEARARGAEVVLVSPGVVPHHYKSPGIEGLSVDALAFMRSWTIQEIIEPTVTRPWNAEDARRHVGFAYRTKPGVVTLIGVTTDGQIATNPGYWAQWPGEYATPIPGTDPAKWDWKPCNVEVPAEPKFDVLAELRGLRRDIPFVGRVVAVTLLDRIIKQLEGN